MAGGNGESTAIQLATLLLLRELMTDDCVSAQEERYVYTWHSRLFHEVYCWDMVATCYIWLYNYIHFPKV